MAKSTTPPATPAEAGAATARDGADRAGGSHGTHSTMATTASAQAVVNPKTSGGTCAIAAGSPATSAPVTAPIAAGMAIAPTP